MSDWQDISTAPKDGTQIDVWCVWSNFRGDVERYRMTDVWWKDTYGGWVAMFNFGDAGTDPELIEHYDKNKSTTRITHWMPIPEPPVQ